MTVDSNRMRWGIPLMLVIIAALVWSSSFMGDFVFDDDHTIVRNSDLAESSLQPIFAPRGFVYLTLLVNRSLGGLHPWHFHLVNLLIHILAGLTLYGIMRRSIRGQSAPIIAAGIAAVWMMHPVQTQSVTYIIQRTESIASLFYLLTLYCMIRGSEQSKPTAWYASSVACCALGMASKEIVVTAPLIALIYDRLFLSGSFRSALKERIKLHACMFGTVIIFTILIIMSGGGYSGDTVGDAVSGVTPVTYMVTQFEVIVHYMKIIFVPASLCFDYQWRLVESVNEVLPQAALVLVLVALTIVAVFKGRRIGFAGVWFFVILAPTSSFFPIADRAVEHRLYLPLAAAAALVVIAIHRIAQLLADRIGREKLAQPSAIAVIAAVVMVLAATTVMRNSLYSSKQALWADVVAQRPDNWRGHYNLANSLAGQQRLVEAIVEFKEAIRLNPGAVKAHSHLGISLILTGNAEAGVEHCLKAIDLSGNDDEQRLMNHVRAAIGYTEMNQHDKALEYLESALPIATQLDNRPALEQIQFMVSEIYRERGQTE